MKVCIFGEYNKNYSRNKIIIDGLRKNDVIVDEFHLSYSKYKIMNYIKTIKSLRKFRNYDAVIFATPSVFSYFFFGLIMRLLFSSLIIFDPFVSMYETEIEDRKRYPKFSFMGLFYWLIDKLSMSIPHINLVDTIEHCKYYTKLLKIKKSKFFVLPVGAWDTTFKPVDYKNNNIKNDKIIILFYGKYIPLQGADIVAKSAIYLPDNYKLKMIGYGQTFNNVKRIVELNNLRNVDLLPPIEYSELREEIAKADICLGIFGTSKKAQRVVPNKVYEPAAMGKPIITADSPSIRRYFQVKKDLIVVPPGDPKKLAKTIIYLVENPSIRNNLANNIYLTYKKNFSTEKLGLNLKNMINNLLKNNL